MEGHGDGFTVTSNGESEERARLGAAGLAERRAQQDWP